MTRSLTWDQFDEAFGTFAASPTSTSVWRWEGRQVYAIDDDEPSLVAFRAGVARPERSVRTDPWMARIATSVVSGKRWRRVRAITEPVTEYTRWELLAYVESTAVGEEIRVLRADSAVGPEDFWAFDGAAPADRHAIVMHYDSSGVPVDLESVTDPQHVQDLLAQVCGLFNDSTPLAEYLAGHGAAGAS